MSGGVAGEGARAGATTTPRLVLDHLVVAASSLAAGRDWCEATLGVAPQAGGRHPSMSTHNLLLSLASPRYPRAYLEIIAIDPEAPPPPRPRWYDLDAPSLRAAIAKAPALVHWVASADDLDDGAARLRALGHDPGDAVAAERQAANGLLRWRITVPGGGGRPAGGAVPLLIAWAGAHPSASLAASGVVIDEVAIGGVAPSLARELGVGFGGRSAPALSAALLGPRGAVALASPAAA